MTQKTKSRSHTQSSQTPTTQVPRRSSWCLVLAAVLILAFGKDSSGASPTPANETQPTPAPPVAADPSQPAPTQPVPTRTTTAPNQPFPTQVSSPKKQSPKPNRRITKVEQLDGVTSIPDELLRAPSAKEERRRGHGNTSSRVVSAHVEAWLSNFDADAQVDGWKIRMALFNADDQLVPVRGHVSITLAPNLIGSDGHAYRVTDIPIQRWSRPLKFDADGLMTVRLPAPPGLVTALDARRSDGRDRYTSPDGMSLVPTASAPFVSASSTDLLGRWGASKSWRDQMDWTRRNRYRFDVYRDARGQVDRLPPYGHLTIRVSVPGQGVFSAETDVRTRPSVKVFERDHLQP